MELFLIQAVIRSWRPEDIPSLVRHANNRRVWRNLKDRFPHPYTPVDADKWIHQATGANPETRFAISIGEEAVGGIGLDLQTDVFRRSAKIGICWARRIGDVA